MKNLQNREYDCRMMEQYQQAIDSRNHIGEVQIHLNLENNRIRKTSPCMYYYYPKHCPKVKILLAEEGYKNYLYYFSSEQKCAETNLPNSISLCQYLLITIGVGEKFLKQPGRLNLGKIIRFTTQKVSVYLYIQ